MGGIANAAAVVVARRADIEVEERDDRQALAFVADPRSGCCCCSYYC